MEIRVFHWESLGAALRPSRRLLAPDRSRLLGRWNPDALRLGGVAPDGDVDAQRCCVVLDRRCGSGVRSCVAARVGRWRGTRRRSTSAPGRSPGRWPPARRSTRRCRVSPSRCLVSKCPAPAKGGGRVTRDEGHFASSRSRYSGRLLSFCFATDGSTVACYPEAGSFYADEGQRWMAVEANRAINDSDWANSGTRSKKSSRLDSEPDPGRSIPRSRRRTM